VTRREGAAQYDKYGRKMDRWGTTYWAWKVTWALGSGAMFLMWALPSTNGGDIFPAAAFVACAVCWYFADLWEKQP